MHVGFINSVKSVVKSNVERVPNSFALCLLTNPELSVCEREGERRLSGT